MGPFCDLGLASVGGIGLLGRAAPSVARAAGRGVCCSAPEPGHKCGRTLVEASIEVACCSHRARRFPDARQREASRRCRRHMPAPDSSPPVLCRSVKRGQGAPVIHRNWIGASLNDARSSLLELERGEEERCINVDKGGRSEGERASTSARWGESQSSDRPPRPPALAVVESLRAMSRRGRGRGREIPPATADCGDHDEGSMIAPE
jgi:hypothetical protein